MAEQEPLKYLELPAKTTETATIVFLHGSGGGWDELDAFALPIRDAAPHIRFIIPKAPNRPFYPGYELPAWFCVTNRDLSKDHDEEGIMESMKSLTQLIESLIESAPYDASRFMFAGFSQGGAMAILTGLSFSKQLAGIFVLSARVPIREKFKTMLQPHSTQVPIFWEHGTSDTLVPYTLGRSSVSFLQSDLGIPTSIDGPEDFHNGITFKSYDGMGHWIDDTEALHISAWLKSTLPDI